MTNARLISATFPAILLSSVACAPPESSDSRALEAASHAIVGGQTDNGHDAVALLYQDPGYICSGTIIDERVYLTAAHCIESLNPNDYLVIGGTDINNDEPDYTINVDEVHIHPGYDPANSLNDVGIVILASDSPVKPYRWLTAGATASEIYEIGTTFTAVGYGDTGNNTGSGKKRKVDMDIVEVYPDITIYGTGTENTCFGDSGGPDLVTIDGYTTVIGVHSFVTGGDCYQYGGSMRTDDNRSFIDNYAQPDAGTAGGSSGGGGGSSSNNPLACSVASVTSRSPVAAALMALVAFGIVVRRRR